MEGCSNCKLPIKKEYFYLPYIEYSELDLGIKLLWIKRYLTFWLITIAVVLTVDMI